MMNLIVTEIEIVLLLQRLPFSSSHVSHWFLLYRSYYNRWKSTSRALNPNIKLRIDAVWHKTFWYWVASACWQTVLMQFWWKSIWIYTVLIKWSVLEVALVGVLPWCFVIYINNFCDVLYCKINYKYVIVAVITKPVSVFRFSLHGNFSLHQKFSLHENFLITQKNSPRSQKIIFEWENSMKRKKNWFWV